MPRLHRAFALIGLLLLTQSATAEKLRLVADAWPPFTDATLVNGGLATDIVSTALARAGYASDFEQVPWARALFGVGEGRTTCWSTVGWPRTSSALRWPVPVMPATLNKCLGRVP